jgi:hypothetical protein
MKFDFNRVARTLVKQKITFTTSHTEPRFEIQGGRFTTEELSTLILKNNPATVSLSEILQGTKTLADSPKDTHFT